MRLRSDTKETKPTKPMMSRASSAKGPGLESARCRRRRRAPGSLQLIHQQCRMATLHPVVQLQLLNRNTDEHFTCHCLIFQPLGRFRCQPFIETFRFQHCFRPVTYLQAARTRSSSKRDILPIACFTVKFLIWSAVCCSHSSCSKGHILSDAPESASLHGSCLIEACSGLQEPRRNAKPAPAKTHASVVASSTFSTSSTSSSYFAEEASKHGLTPNRHVLLAELSVWSTYIIQVEAGQKGKTWQNLPFGPGVAKCWHEQKLTDNPNTSST